MVVTSVVLIVHVVRKLYLLVFVGHGMVASMLCALSFKYCIDDDVLSLNFPPQVDEVGRKYILSQVSAMKRRKRESTHT